MKARTGLSLAIIALSAALLLTIGFKVTAAETSGAGRTAEPTYTSLKSSLGLSLGAVALAAALLLALAFYTTPPDVDAGADRTRLERDGAAAARKVDVAALKRMDEKMEPFEGSGARFVNVEGWRDGRWQPVTTAPVPEAGSQSAPPAPLQQEP